MGSIREKINEFFATLKFFLSLFVFGFNFLFIEVICIDF